MYKILCGLFLCLALLSAIASAAPTSEGNQVKEVQQQVQGLDKDVAALKEASGSRLDALDTRIDSIKENLIDRLGSQDKRVEYLGAAAALQSNLIALLGLLITVIVFAASLAGYFTATKRAKEEAETAVQKWFHEKEAALESQMSGLQAQITGALQDIEKSKNEVDHHAARAVNEIDLKVAQQILSGVPGKDSASESPPDPASVAVVRKVSQALQSIPEKEFTSEDHYARGLDELVANRFDSALLSFDKALDKALEESISPERYAGLMFARAVTLKELDQRQEAVEVYDEIDRRFGRNASPVMREQVAGALVNKGAALGQRGLHKDAIIVSDQILQRYGSDDSPAMREHISGALINKGISLGQLGRSEEAIAVYDEIEQRYGSDDNRVLRTRVSGALGGRAFLRILQAKQHWSVEEKRRELLALALEDLSRSKEQYSEANQAMILGNLGYALFLSEQTDQAEEPTRECLRLGGEKSLEAQRGDAQLHRIEPQDIEYEKLLNRLWDELHPGSTGGEEPETEPV